MTYVKINAVHHVDDFLEFGFVGNNLERQIDTGTTPFAGQAAYNQDVEEGFCADWLAVSGPVFLYL